MPSTVKANRPWEPLDLAADSLATVNRTVLPAGMRTLPPDPVTLWVTWAVILRPAVSVRELIESSRAAWISVPMGSVRAARSSSPDALAGEALLTDGVGAPMATADAAESAGVESVRAVAVVSVDVGLTVSRL